MNGSSPAMGAGRADPAPARYTPAAVWLSLLAIGAIVHAAGPATFTMADLGGLCLATLAQMGAALAVFPFLKQQRPIRVVAFVIAACVVLLAPFLISHEARALRFVTACAAVVLTMKLWDLQVHVARGDSVEWSRFLPFLFNVFSVVFRNEAAEAPPREKVLRDLRRGLTGSIAGVLAVFTLYLVPWRGYPLLVEHAVKASVIFLAILSWFGAVVAAVRLSGVRMRDFSDAPLLARTPADFWRRYNRVFQHYFHENVFKRAGGRRAPAAVTILIFGLSALMHEYVFGIAIGRVQGFQTAFFLLQGVAVAATLRVRPNGRAAVLVWTAATIAFNLFTSLLFFLSFHAIVKLYANPLPAWLQR